MTRKELRQLHREVFDGPRSIRQLKARSWVERADTSAHALRAELADNTRHYRQHLEAWSGRDALEDEVPRTEPIERARTRWTILGGWAAGLLEVLFAAFLATSLLAIPDPVAVVIGVVVVLLIAGLAKAAFLRLHHPERPRQSLATLQRWSGVLFWITLAALVPLLLARSYEWAAPAVLAAFVVLSLGLPALAGALLVVAFVTGWRDRFVRRRERLEQELAETERAARELRELIDPPERVLPRPVPRVDGRVNLNRQEVHQ